MKYRDAVIFQGVIHRVRQRMDNGRLLIPGHDDAAAAVTLQVANQRAQPFFMHL